MLRDCGFPKVRGTFLGAPIMRPIVFGGLLGSPHFGKLPFREMKRIPSFRPG